ncbi:MAG: tail fiber domain-containing protein, partial [Armatimonadia bacterium]
NSSGQIYFQTGNTPRCGISTAGHFLPSTSSNYDLGSSTYRWRDGHFSGTVAAGTVRPQTNNTYDLGSSTYRWRDIYLQTSLVFSTTSTLIGISNGGIYFQTGTTARGGWDSSGNLVPAVNSTSSSTGYYCGISNYKWRAVYAYNGTIQTSDIRDKAGVEDSDLGLDFILALTPRSYRWKDLPGEEETAPASSWIAPLDLGGSTKTQEKSDGLAEPLEEPGGEASGTAESPKEDGGLLEPQSSQPSAPTTPRHKTLDDGRHYGLVAQEVRDALQGKDFAGYIHEEESDGYFLNYAEFISPLIKAVQELAAKVAALESQLADTKAP